MYQIRNNIRYKTGKRRKFAKFIEMSMQEYTILRYKKIAFFTELFCGALCNLQKFCKGKNIEQIFLYLNIVYSCMRFFENFCCKGKVPHSTWNVSNSEQYTV